MASKYFDNIKGKISPETEIFVSKSLDIIDQVYYILHEKNMKPRDLAKELGKFESEVSKWLSGGHNITLKTIARLEAALNAEIITTPLRSKGTFYTDFQELEQQTARIVKFAKKEIPQYFSFGVTYKNPNQKKAI